MGLCSRNAIYHCRKNVHLQSQVYEFTSIILYFHYSCSTFLLLSVNSKNDNYPRFNFELRHIVYKYRNTKLKVNMVSRSITLNDTCLEHKIILKYVRMNTTNSSTNTKKCRISVRNKKLSYVCV